MSRELVPQVTEGMMGARAKDKLAGDGTPKSIFTAMCAHPDFRAQLRAWAAEEMRGLVPKLNPPEPRDSLEYRQRYESFQKDMDWLRERITAWEKANEGQ